MMKKHPHFLVCIGLLCCLAQTKAQVLINELQASNASTISDPDNGKFSDWLEIYNAGSSPVDLTNWHLSDSDDPAEWAFPNSTIIAPKGFLLIWADGSGNGLHTSFKLGAEGEQLALFNANDNKVSEVVFVKQPTDISFGLKTDGGLPWGYFSQPTPGTSNNASTFYTDYVRQIPVFSIPGGFYQSDLNVTIFDKYQAGIIRYTLDGSVPTESTAEFSQPLTITSTTVVKARMFYPDELPGPVVTNTYFINESFEHRGLAVLSLSTDPKYFFAPDSGLYVQDFKPTWEYPIHLEFYEPDGLLGFHHDAGVQIGGQNAWVLPQKLLNIYSRKNYGSGHFDYQVFPENPRKQFGDIILRASGSDWSNTLFRDGLMQRLIKQEADLDGQDFRPCLVYINGQFFGIHNIREKQDADYTEYYHDISSDSLDYIENDGEIKEGDDVAYHQLVTLLTAGVQTTQAFQALDSIADTKNFTDYIISEIYVANTSWGHNIALYRKRSSQAQWRWLMHDYDRGFNLNNVGSIGMAWATATNGSPGSNDPYATLFLRKMLQNTAFKENFITRFADHLYITYNPVTINQGVDLHANWIRAEMPDQVARWLGTTSSYGNAIPSIGFWENEVAKLKQFGQLRNEAMFTDLSNFFGLAGSTQLNLEVSNAAHGYIRLHEMKVPSYPWTGKYIRNRDFTLTAVENPGFNFARWEKRTGTKTTLLPAGSQWKYRDAAIAPPADWNQPSFDDTGWTSGQAQLGYGDGDETTVISYGNDPNNKIPSYYFRANIDVQNLDQIDGLLGRLKVDDGAVVYLNGIEIWRQNMPAAPATISFGTFALSGVTGSGEEAWNEFSISADKLQIGQNLIAIEVHQIDPTSSDISFDFELSGTIYGMAEILGTSPALHVTLDANPLSLVAVFESDGTCGYLPDTLAQNQTLTLACSPYIASGSVVVKPFVTLTVEPGVEIQFPEKANLWVYGDIQMNGTDSQPILIKNTADAPAWGGIFLKQTTATSQFDYVKLENATAGTQRLYFPAAISAYSSNMKLNHMDLTAVRDNPVFARLSDVTMSNSKLKSAVTGDCINVKQGFAIVENCDFEGGRQPDMDAIDYDGVVGGIVRGNRIHDFRGDNCDGLDIGENCQDLLIENNFIYHCFDKGISVGQQSSAFITNNVIAYTNIGIALKDESHVEMQHCTFFGNQYGVSAYEKNPGNLGGTGNIVDCIVSNASIDAYVNDTYSGLTVINCLSDLDSISSPGTFNVDPRFIDPTWFDFNLMPNSPAIGIGTSGSNLGSLSIPYYPGQPQLMISEILYNDTLSNTGEFLELYNPGNTAVNLEGFTISAAVEFVFPAGASIGPRGSVVVAKEATNFQGASYPVFEWTTGKLRNEGEVIYLFDTDGLLVDFVRYNNHAPWPESNTLLGRSIEVISTSLDNHFATSWKPSELAGGTPGEVLGISGTGVALNNSKLVVYPNPASEEIIVSGEWNDHEIYRLTGIDGKVWATGMLNGSIQITQVPEGLYMLMVQNDKGMSSIQVVVNK